MGALLAIGAWFGILAGLVEGVGLLAFQKINWTSWGAGFHFSTPILWAAPLVDLVLFSVIGLLLGVAGRRWSRLPVLRVAVLTFSWLTLYDWLLIPRRLEPLACALLAAGISSVLWGWIRSRPISALNFWRRTLPALAVLFAVALVGVEGGRRLLERRKLASLPQATEGSPNVVVIVIDTMRADHLSAYGYGRPTSPNIDAVARQGVLFENAVSTTSWTFPSHVSLLTGRYSFEHRLGKVPYMPVLGSSDRLIAAPMIGEELERRGYRTGAFSGNRTYFVENLGFGRGFIHFEDYYFSLEDVVRSTVLGTEIQYGLLSRHKVVTYLSRFVPENVLRYIRKRPSPRKEGDEVNREVLRWIDAGPQSHPFFVFLNYFDVHIPYGGPEQFPKPVWRQDDSLGQYDDGVRYVDDCIGRLLAELDKRGLSKNTLVVITGDHGEALEEHGLLTHGDSLYWDLIHVPLIFSYPGHLPAGARVPNVVSNAFLPATLSSFLPGKSHFAFPGEPLARLWNGSTSEGNSSLALAELSENALYADLKNDWKHIVPSDSSGPMKSLVNGDWQLIVHRKFGAQLYDWKNDPQEMHDLIQTPRGQEMAGILMGQMLSILAGRKGEQEGIAAAAPLDPEGDGKTQLVRMTTGNSPLNDYYRIRGKAGAVIELKTEVMDRTRKGALAAVLAVEDEQGRVLQSCRNPEDDHLPPPGVSDPTPGAFDDMCLNNGGNPNADSEYSLQVLIPGAEGTPVDLYIRVTDWDGTVVAAGSGYEISMREKMVEPLSKSVDRATKGRPDLFGRPVTALVGPAFINRNEGKPRRNN